MTIRSSETLEADDESTRWFDEAYASSIKPLTERTPATFATFVEDLEDRREHAELMASFGREAHSPTSVSESGQLSSRAENARA